MEWVILTQGVVDQTRIPYMQAVRVNEAALHDYCQELATAYLEPLRVKIAELFGFGSENVTVEIKRYFPSRVLKESNELWIQLLVTIKRPNDFGKGAHEFQWMDTVWEWLKEARLAMVDAVKAQGNDAEPWGSDHSIDLPAECSLLIRINQHKDG